MPVEALREVPQVPIERLGLKQVLGPIGSFQSTVSVGSAHVRMQMMKYIGSSNASSSHLW